MAGDFFSCGVSPLGTAPVVFDQVAIMNDRVDSLLQTTTDLAAELASYQIANMSFTIDPTVVQSYVLRDVNIDVDFDLVDTDEIGDVPGISLATVSTPALPTDAPLQPADAPAPAIPPSPTAYHTSFGPAPVPVFPTMPSYADLTSGVPFPTLYPITLPGAPAVNFGIPFTATPPVFTAEAPDAAMFDYTEQDYNPLLVAEIKTVLQKMYAGETGLPRVVEDALFARAAQRESETAAAATQEAFEEMASRGFTLPSGMLQSKLMQTRQNSQNQKNNLSREVMIQIHNTLIDQLKFGVAQGIALENLWADLYNNVQNRRLQAAQVAVNIAISVYNALVAQYQAQAEVYKVEAEVYATRIQAELAKLQAYGEELRAQQLIGQLNQQQVDLYRAQLEAIETNVRVYLADIQAYTAKIEGEKLKLDTYRTQIETEQAKLSSSRLEFDIWNGQLNGQELVQRAYQTRAQTYLGNVQAWRTKYEAQIDRQRGEIAAIEAETARYVALVQGLSAKFQAIVQRGQLIVSNNTSKVQKFAAESTASSAYNNALSEKFRMLNSANAQNTDLALKNGEINVQNALSIRETMLHALQTAVQVLGQLTASMSSNVNMNASVSDSTGFNQACSYSTSQQIG